VMAESKCEIFDPLGNELLYGQHQRKSYNSTNKKTYQNLTNSEIAIDEVDSHLLTVRLSNECPIGVSLSTLHILE
jgi:hypothetical protein